MKKLIHLIIVFAVYFSSFGQNDSLENKGKVIVQVYGVADYNLTQNAQNKYGFGIGRTHFGCQYQFNDKTSAKINSELGENITTVRIT